MPLVAVPITVHPNPRLYLKYFHQRDVYSDDPFTDPIEPSIPYSLAIMVENRGHGVTKNMHITSSQPKIVENESGLLIQFQIVGCSFGSQSGDVITLVLGDLGPHRDVNGYWIMTSSLDGRFVEFTATLTHLA